MRTLLKFPEICEFESSEVIDRNSTQKNVDESIVDASGEIIESNNDQEVDCPVIAELHEEKISETKEIQDEAKDATAMTSIQPEITPTDEDTAAIASIFDITGAKDAEEKNADVERVKTSHLELSDESSDEDIDEILNKDDHDTSFESNVEDPEEHHDNESLILLPSLAYKS